MNKRGRPKKENKDTEQSFDKVKAVLEKKYGKGILIELGKDYRAKGIDAISTGSLGLNKALGVGGIPRGRVIEVFGPEGSGKTTLSYSIIKQAQLVGGKAAFIDAEHAFDYDYAKKVGINLEELTMCQPDYGEQGLDVLQTLVESSQFSVVVVDSVAALTPKAEIEGEMEDAQIGLQARLMAKALRKLTASISKTKTTVLFINQIRMKIGISWGSPETTPGGRALKFFSSVRIDLRRMGHIKKGEELIGSQIKAKIVKNKVAPPFRICTFDIYYDEGLSESSDILNLAIVHGILKKSGAWISYKEENIAQGNEQGRQLLKENKELRNELKDQVLKLLGKENVE